MWIHVILSTESPPNHAVRQAPGQGSSNRSRFKIGDTTTYAVFLSSERKEIAIQILFSMILFFAKNSL